jgi:FMN phosphatase YigB (HAD superfamily)
MLRHPGIGMAIELVILDFDGTFTDAYLEAEPFVEGFRRDLFDLLGRQADAEWIEEEATIAANPTAYGWRNGDHVTAPAIADPYLHASAVAQNLCDRFGILENKETRSEILQTLYRKNYPLTRSVPRPDAKLVLEKLLQRGLVVYVVTNSRTDAVQDKLDQLDIEGAEALVVIGDAKKFVIDDEPRDDVFDALSDLEMPGLDTRKVLVKRGHYYDVLRSCWDRTGARPNQTLVVGDIFELDLVLPLALGARVHLIVREQTPDYEIAYVKAHPSGSTSEDLAGLLTRL